MIKFYLLYGEMSEWFKELVLKTSDPARDQGFESLSLRQFINSCYCESAACFCRGNLNNSIDKVLLYIHGGLLKW